MEPSINGKPLNNNFSVASAEEHTAAYAIRRQKEAECSSLKLSNLPEAFWGFLDPHKGLGDIPDTQYLAARG